MGVSEYLKEIEVISGRDVNISIDNKQFLQAESAEIRTLSDIHNVRACFCNDDIAHVKGRKEYKVTFTGLKFKQPFENCNFYDLDNFTMVIAYDNMTITLKGCMWSDFLAAADKSKFREKVSITALTMDTEEVQ